MSNRWIPRRFGEHKDHKDLKKLASSDLKAGDILVVKEWSNTASDVRFIRTSQAIFSHVRGGSSQSEHILINCEDASVFAIESAGAGVTISQSITRRDHEVYSCINDELRWEASQVARRLAGDHRAVVENIDGDDDDQMRRNKEFNAYARTPAQIDYRGRIGMAASVFRSNRQGHFASKRLEKLYQIAYEGGNVAGVKMICSEFVAACYEVAALRLSRRLKRPYRAPFGEGVDPRGLTAKAMEAVLRRSNAMFLRAGRYKGTVPVPGEERLRAEAAAATYVEICKAKNNGQRLPVSDAYRLASTDPVLSRLYGNDLGSLEDWTQNMKTAYYLHLLTQ